MTDFLAELEITIDDETITQAWHTTSRLAELHSLSAYDAAYLELAIRLNLPLATHDQRLAQAARRNGIAVLPAA